MRQECHRLVLHSYTLNSTESNIGWQMIVVCRRFEGNVQRAWARNCLIVGLVVTTGVGRIGAG